MAFMGLYDRRNLRYPEQETEETLQPGYTSPQIRAWGAQRFGATQIPQMILPGGSGPSPIPTPRYGGRMIEGIRRPAQPTPQKQPAGPNVTPFLWNMMSSMRDMDTESRGEYLETVMTSEYTTVHDKNI